MSRENEEQAFRFEATARTPDEHNFMSGVRSKFETSPFSTLERLMNFPMYVPRQNLANFLIRYEMFKRVLNIHGSIVECGTLFGGGAMAWSQMSAMLEPVNHTRRVVAFDTFAGFPSLAAEDEPGTGDNAAVGGLAVDSYHEIKQCAALHDQNRAVGHIPKLELVKGDANETIPAYVAQNPHLVVSLLYLDFDIYEPTKTALQHFLPIMPKGAIIGFDELNIRDWPGETIAVKEIFELRKLRIERFPFGSTMSFAQLD
ncbi:macrocin O-methyltransferase [Gammaproteobacteria bacterium]|nr:macrocin O-methyltransferase [Gammaproteobacteria bacterium]MDC3279521.1 TylF/MycF family methyltransferase [Gammaproteobacteria bacterium]